jgi:hypothetical protein
MLVSINNVSSGTCVWCRQSIDDGVQAQFKDGFAGFFCKKDFWAALKARAGEQPGPSESRTPASKGQQT